MTDFNLLSATQTGDISTSELSLELCPVCEMHFLRLNMLNLTFPDLHDSWLEATSF